MKGAFLDGNSLGLDIDQSRLEAVLDPLETYEHTAPEDVVSRLAGVDIAVVNKVQLNEAHFAQLPDLKMIAVTATGTNNIDMAAAEARGIRVYNVERYGRPTIVQHTFSLILALANRLLDYDSDVRSGHWNKSDMFCLMGHPIVELDGKKMGVVGYGDLGQGVARMAEAFGMDVMIAARPGQSTDSVDGLPRVPLDQMLPKVDVLSIHCLLSPETRNLIDAAALAKMKQSAFLINVARGGIVDELALADALRSGRLAGAGIDVLTEEPPVQGNVLLDQSIPNLIVTPHCAWASKEARQRLLEKTADNIAAFIG
ncbi:MAG: D-2-hydroxyacid dehydrogenase [Pseudomonadales bacterium]|uniref:Lactate dehydrogenase and related dehydrogenase n=1 Tax=Oleiphilus messinensis TaxID=141451 RepID=A0A1Y0I5N2_9GAMM|nr:D-2-hydroxyacid dehydrogenase [Oleiphilus messinensis]ARU55772.1 lactate dehydrogenase and related dehydrogenase [Oleiphilus messinensis]MCG8613442.1 D-2-hydroxyacid dehydrogenase [Pseudomonadales bacterium]